MGTRIGLCLLLASLLAQAPARAQVVYDSISSGTDGVAFVGDLVIDDLTVDGGGLLQSVRVLVTADAATTTDVTLLLALDGGDGFPDVTGTGDDAFQVAAFIPGVSLAAGVVTELTFDVADRHVLVPDGALYFGGLEFTSFNAGHVFAGAPSPGTSDPIVFSFGAMGPAPAPGVADPMLTGSHALSFRLGTAPLPPDPGSVGVVGDVIDFESLDEGFLTDTLSIGGVTFSQPFNGFDPPGTAIFSIDDGTDAWAANPGMLGFVQGKTLQINAYSGGGGYTFAACKSMRITPDGVRTAVALSVDYVVEILGGVDYSGNLITLMALRDGVPVGATSIKADNVLGASGGGSFTFGAGRLEMSGLEFDDLVLFTNGHSPFGHVQMGVDNVVVGEAVGGCSPADLAEPFGQLDFSDVVAYLSAFGVMAPEADLALPFGQWDFSDVIAFLGMFGGGCP